MVALSTTTLHSINALSAIQLDRSVDRAGISVFWAHFGADRGAHLRTSWLVRSMNIVSRLASVTNGFWYVAAGRFSCQHDAWREAVEYPLRATPVPCGQSATADSWSPCCDVVHSNGSAAHRYVACPQ